ncbi:MAG: hypothetical protein KDI16_06805 [Halioglobus sp.]|nr:hypothetical protein [Halioglobus sp.]
MTYLCKDCSYRGTRGGRAGHQCPACGSLNIGRHLPHTVDRQTPGPGRLVLLVVLWGCLFGLIGWKLSH